MVFIWVIERFELMNRVEIVDGVKLVDLNGYILFWCWKNE